MLYINKQLYIDMLKNILFIKSKHQIMKQSDIPYGNPDNISLRYDLVKRIFFKYNSYNNKTKWALWYRYNNIRDFLLSLYQHINYNTVYIYKGANNEIIYNKYNNNLIKELLYRLYYNIEYNPVCKYCHKNKVEFTGERMWKTYCCKECENKDTINKIITGYVDNYNKININNQINKDNIDKLSDIPGFEQKRIKKCKETYLLRYGTDWFNNRDKMKETKLERYNNSSYVNPIKAIETKIQKYGSLSYISQKALQTKYNRYGYNLSYIKDKVKETCYNKYGVSYITQTSLFQEKSKLTKLERYNNAYWNNPEQVMKTVIERYNVSYVLNADEVKQKIIETCYNKYGYRQWNQTELGKKYVSYIMSLPGTQAKINQTKRKNNTFNKSKPEDECYILLCDKFGPDNVLRQYKSDLYPFNCDFYIKPNDLLNKEIYIECNFHWTHNSHLYDKNNKDNINILNKWKEKAKKSKFYSNAIKTWTERDVIKYKTAKTNNLNWFCFYKKSDFDDFLRRF